ncbi:MAG: hypothetical protein JNL79_29130 [Myxococcales bacterium]|nr:hypothetical protein [Myxococcales bacterium]
MLERVIEVVGLDDEGVVVAPDTQVLEALLLGEDGQNDVGVKVLGFELGHAAQAARA